MKFEAVTLDEGLHVHPWLKTVSVSYVPGPTNELVDSFAENLLQEFSRLGHRVLPTPEEPMDILFTTAQYGVPISWRTCLSLTARHLYDLSDHPTVITIINVPPAEFEQVMDHFTVALEKSEPDPVDFDFPGLAENAMNVFYEHGRRGGPILALERLVQAQAMCIRVLMVVGDREPQKVFHFDLVGGHPSSDASSGNSFYQDIVLRVLTSVSTYEITEHEVVDDPIRKDLWETLQTPDALQAASRQFDQRNFFTDMVRIQDIVTVPVVGDVIADQYSEGCFATWEPRINGLIATITGSARPVDKSNITEDDLSVIVGVRSDRKGALVRHVEGLKNDPPSTEAVEMMDMDEPLPWIQLPSEWGIDEEVPVIRSKLHGHRGVSSYNPNLIEFVPLDPQFYQFPVTCATEAQAVGIKQAFARSEALKNSKDPRQLIFTVLPTHGVVIAEKWVHGKQPFELMWEYMDAGHLKIVDYVPQGKLVFTPSSPDMMSLHENLSLQETIEFGE